MQYVITIGKFDQTIEVNSDSINEAGMQYLIAYGLKQSLNDCIAAKDLVGEAAWKKVYDRLAAIQSGTVRERGDSLDIYTRAAINTLKSKGILKTKAPKGTAPEDWIAEYELKVESLKSNPKFRAAVDAKIAAEKAVREMDAEI